MQQWQSELSNDITHLLLITWQLQVHICISIPSPWVFGWKGGPSTIVHWKMYTFPNRTLYPGCDSPPLSYEYVAKCFAIYTYYTTCMKVSDRKDEFMQWLASMYNCIQHYRHDVKLTIACLGIQVWILYASTQQINVECAWDALPQWLLP